MSENVTSLEEYRALKDAENDGVATPEEAQEWCDKILDVLTGGTVLEQLQRVADGDCEKCYRQGRRYELGRFKLCHTCARRRLKARAKEAS